MKLVKNINFNFIRFKEEDLVKSEEPDMLLGSRTVTLLNTVTWGEYFFREKFPSGHLSTQLYKKLYETLSR